jgi:hypothetical protein
MIRRHGLVVQDKIAVIPAADDQAVVDRVRYGSFALFVNPDPGHVVVAGAYPEDPIW